MVWQALAADALKSAIDGGGTAADTKGASGEQDVGARTAGRDITEQEQITKDIRTGDKSFNTTGVNFGSILQPFEGSPANGGGGVSRPSPLISSFKRMGSDKAAGLSYEKKPALQIPNFDKGAVIPVIGILTGGLVLMIALRRR